jgi:hypothetical protein
MLTQQREMITVVEGAYFLLHTLKIHLAPETHSVAVGPTVCPHHGHEVSSRVHVPALEVTFDLAL